MERIMKNIGIILEEAGATFKDILKCSVYARNLSQLGTINKIYNQFF